MRSIVHGFRDFIMRGNAIELAVGVVIGAAFNTVIQAIVNDLINPIIGAVFGKPDFNDLWHITLRHDVGTTTGADGTPQSVDAVLNLGGVITALVQFLTVAIALYFFIVLPMNKLAERRARGKVAEPPAPAEDIRLLTDIRDLLAQDRGPDGTVSAGHGPAGPHPTRV
ncbi:large conductance mechanosensitive channel protein MscL [Luteimicrobium subarcticum]|uniref:Large-conductance mechanosensitive channel n=1 Tax=Luteimicrobium subarcticum TaxID=620910 RepID=A0A2M8WT17_9MICO|nr:large conductance mechanosensitive channel protein MscL [Luteimicrobium subarcticum]PJI94044.1 large conductance mechanosensitive channel [Luteimicrobium subarcticum]